MMSFRRYILAFGILLCVSFSPQNSKASHIFMGNFDFTCLGGDTFLVRLHLLRDCSGASIPSFVNPTLNFPQGCSQPAIVESWTRDSVLEVSRLCPDYLSQSTCNPGGSFPGGEHGYYSAIYVLPVCDSGAYEFYLDFCCRNAGGNYFRQPRMVIDAKFHNKSGYECNNSPLFNEWPIPFVCVDQPVNFNWGLREYDGDSMSFYLADALQGIPSTVNPGIITYDSNYSGTNPFPVPVRIDSETGQVSFLPNISMIHQFWVIKVCADEYRGDVLLGTYCRDISLVVINCDNIVPQMRTPGITNLQNGIKVDSLSVEVYPGDTLRLDLFFDDSLHQGQVNTGDSVTLTPLVDPILFPGANYTVQNGNPAVFSFEWPAVFQTRRSKFVSVGIEDDACPLVGFNGYTFQVKVVVPRFEFYSDTLCLSSPPVEITPRNSNFQGSFFGPGITGDFFDPAIAGVGTHRVGYAFNNIDTAYIDFTVISDSLYVSFDMPDTLCLTDPPFEFQNVTPPGGYFLGSGVVLNRFEPSTAGLGTHEIIYNADTLDCPAIDIQHVTVIDGPEITIEAGSICLGDTLEMSANATHADSIVWTSGHRGSTAAVSPQFSTYYWATAYGLGGCHATATTLVVVHDLPFGFLPPDTVICENQAVDLGPLGGFDEYRWSTGEADSTILFEGWNNEEGIYTFILSVTDEFGCEGKDTVVVTLQDCNTSMGGDLGSDQSVKVYPNPTSGDFIVEVQKLWSEPTEIKLFDASGRLVYSTRKLLDEGMNQISINIPGLSAGSYILQLESGDSRETVKLNVMR